MIKISSDAVDQFANALQLSITTRVDRVRVLDNGLGVVVPRRPRDDPGWAIFEQLVAGRWRTAQEYHVPIHDTGELHNLTQFMLISRLQPRNFEPIAAQVPAYRPLLARLGIVHDAIEVETLEQMNAHFFEQVHARGLTIRQLAAQSGLSPVAISNFKAGKDIRLSNFLRLLRPIGLRLLLGGGAKTAPPRRG